jgi:alkanesulfonate monooxygenase SsuD/methylene tetrahydromethanopterin reductase-like flavin-dependent oxidoreductase (luciferase family)
MLGVWRAADDIELGSPGQRSDRFEEACEVITGLLSRPVSTFTGRFYQLTRPRRRRPPPRWGRAPDSPSST